MKMFLLLSLLTAGYEEAPQPAEDTATARTCADLTAKLTERKRVLADALVASARALVRYDDALKSPLPKKPTDAQLRRAGDEVLAAHAEREHTEKRLALARGSLESMQSYVTEERKRLGCTYPIPHG